MTLGYIGRIVYRLIYTKIMHTNTKLAFPLRLSFKLPALAPQFC